MRKMMFSLLTMSALLWVGCTQPADVDAMLQNEDSRAEIFAAIVEDHGMMTEFVNEMKSSEHAMMMMKGDGGMMSGMMAAEGDMMKMMQKDSAMMRNMMSGMMKDGKMMSHMLQMMNQQDMMSDECLQSCMKMMQDKGMSMDMGNMDMMQH